ncbi:hypothetical protein LJR296_008016 [Cupriavidus necator]|uniref:hypothetical protein n=1 Tax=Cupriavidus necator TaxID=106590 RepID=UPI003ECF2C7C
MNITHERKDVVDHNLVRLVVYDDSPEPGTKILGTHTSLVAHRSAGWLTIGVRKRTAVRSAVKVATLSPDACRELYAMLREIYEA